MLRTFRFKVEILKRRKTKHEPANVFTNHVRRGNTVIIIGMGSFIELNDTLQLTQEQGFPSELDLEQHLRKPYNVGDIKDKVFAFNGKSDIRIYKIPPVRNFLVENRDGKWIYWGLVHILEVTHDYVNKTTSGKFKIIRINTPEEMKDAFALIDMRPDFNYFSGA